MLRQSGDRDRDPRGLCLLCRGVQRFFRHVAQNVAAGEIGEIRHCVADVYDLLRQDAAAAGALIARFLRHVSEQHGAVEGKRQNAVVFQQHGARFGDAPGQCVMGVKVDGLGFRRDLLCAVNRIQNAGNAGVDVAFRKRAVGYRLRGRFLHIDRAAGHIEIAPGMKRGDPIVQRAPVGNDRAGKAPVAAQNVGQKPVIVARKHAVDLVVGAHDHPGLCGFDRQLKRRQIDFAQRALIHDAVAVLPLVFLRVDRKMLETGGNACFLLPADERGGHRTGSERVLGKVFKVSSGERIALDVAARSEHDRDVCRDRLARDRFALQSKQRFVPRRAARHRRRETGGREGVIGAENIGLRRLAPKPVRAVGHRDCVDAERRDRLVCHISAPVQ